MTPDADRQSALKVAPDDWHRGISVIGLDHVQLAMPPGMEESARAFYSNLLGLQEVKKPAILAARGGCWFVGGSVHIHLGIESDFRPASKAHPAFVIDDLDVARQILEAAGVAVMTDDSIPVRRFYANDPFGNRLEFIDAADRHFTARCV